MYPAMRSFLLFIFSLIALGAFAQTDKQLLERELFNMPNVSFTDVTKPGDPYLTYDLMIKQPIDHQHPEKGSFYQWVTIASSRF